jgi:dihydroorotase
LDRIEITRPDDWHLHLRDGSMLASTVPPSASVFRRAIVMPNLKPPVTTLGLAEAYYERILAARPEASDFQPLMTLYLTDETTPEAIQAAAASGLVFGCKLYPAGATTHSDSGVLDPGAINHLYEALEQTGLPLLVHGEVTDTDVDIFDREKVFIDRHLTGIRARFPELRIVFEHVTTHEGVQFVKEAGGKTGATVTPQHLLLNRNDLLVGGVRPHNYCLPVLKRNIHQQSIQQALLEGHPRFFLGTDSAPHVRADKETACGCAGCFSAPAALPLYAHFFDQHDALDQLEAFAAFNGADFYGLPRNRDSVELVRSDWTIPDRVSVEAEPLVPLLAGKQPGWELAGDSGWSAV